MFILSEPGVQGVKLITIPGKCKVSSIEGSNQWVAKTYDHVQISRQKPILQDAAIGNIDPLTFVGHDCKSHQYQ